MKAKSVIGRKIIAIRQQRFYNGGMGRFQYDFNSITLDNGARIMFTAGETEYEPTVHAWLVTPDDIENDRAESNEPQEETPQ